MRSRLCLVTASLVLASCSSPPTVQSLLEEARTAMGASVTIKFSGTGSNGFFGQALTAGEPWPVRQLTTYTRSIDYDQRITGETVEYADANAFPMRTPPDIQELKIWLTPHGFLKAAAQASDAKLIDDNTISFTAPGNHLVTGTFGPEHRLLHVETRIADPVLGEIPLAITYSGYTERGAISFPTSIVEEQGGAMTWDLNIDNVDANAPVDIPAPPSMPAPAANPVTSERVAEGVWLLMGGSHHSVLVEFADFLTVIEAPLNGTRAAEVIREAKILVPDKPLRYVVSTHHHFDHAGGLRAFAAQGATVVTHASNTTFFAKAFGNTAKFESVTDKHVITDGMRNLEVHQIAGDTHTTELLVAYLPAERILVEADAYSPNDPAARPNPAPPNAVNLYDKIVALKLNVSTLAPVHGRGAVPIAEFRRFVNK